MITEAESSRLKANQPEPYTTPPIPGYPCIKSESNRKNLVKTLVK
jgi:hypothetical protein